MWPAALPLGSEVNRDPVAELKGDSEAEMGALRAGTEMGLSIDKKKDGGNGL